ncbi:MAG: mercury methylation ferredoxin HgcB [Pseudomonadota bacterium]
MKEFRYLTNVSTLKLDETRCLGCGSCALVCPHGVYIINGKKAEIADLDGCMECGACRNNCPTAAINLTPGVGCAAYIIQAWIKGKKGASCGPAVCC